MSNKSLKITPEIAELCGAITGDGCLSRSNHDYKIIISCNKVEDLDYLIYISSLFHQIFGKTPKLKIEKEYARLSMNSKSILEFFEEIGLFVGKKAKVATIPPIVIDNRSCALAFLRGLADTDFSVNFKKGGRKNNSYPKIVGEFASEQLISDICSVLRSVDISYYRQDMIRTTNFGSFPRSRVEINGRKNFHKWLNIIGFSNPKHITKITVWENLGYCPPYTTHSQRLNMLKEMGKASPPHRIPAAGFEFAETT